MNKGDELLPDLNRVKCEINQIVSKGVRRPEPFFKLLYKLYKQIGLRFVFRDARAVSIAVLMVTSLMVFLIITQQEQINFAQNPYGIIMISSPILYGVLSLLPFLSSEFLSTVEVEMACKYTLEQLAVFRMLLFSICCFLLNTLWVLLMLVKFSSFHFVQALMVSTTSLLLFALLFLYALTWLRSVFSRLLFFIGWISINAVPILIDSSLYQRLLITIPWGVYLIIISVTFLLYLKKIKLVFIQDRSRGAIIYVNN
ncbi:hypothetical protein SAMN04488134_107130 [Amphibacillus marinus]|uniref:ABC-2 family transporter protein n=1 Tax=Amphibacillus marinus TaxID=872970 RepID=A0A1H8PNZ4_9BACI|nr:hypothetical protein [Amphibacillus marinus]SEO43404.1 hypothetical protein SAMN04488134_107130 [Amphibacillus marinus]